MNRIGVILGWWFLFNMYYPSEHQFPCERCTIGGVEVENYRSVDNAIAMGPFSSRQECESAKGTYQFGVPKGKHYPDYELVAGCTEMGK